MVEQSGLRGRASRWLEGPGDRGIGLVGAGFRYAQASPTTRSSPASSATSARSASMTAFPRCTAGRSPAAYCGRVERRAPHPRIRSGAGSPANAGPSLSPLKRGEGMFRVVAPSPRLRGEGWGEGRMPCRIVFLAAGPTSYDTDSRPGALMDQESSDSGL